LYFIFASFFIALFIYLFTNVSFTLAQFSSFGISNQVPIKGESVLDGYIVVSENEGFAISSEASQENLVGVVTENPAIEVSSDSEGTYPLATSGEAYVWVTLANGDIAKGDGITSSPWAGIGMKANGSSSTIGTSLDDAKADDAKTREQLVTKIRILISPTEGGGFVASKSEGGLLKKSGEFTSSSLLRYGVGSLIIVITILLSLWFFGGIAKSGVDALGRNPHAALKIQFGIMINVFVGFAIALVGIITALYIMN